MKVYCQMETGYGKKNIEDRVLIGNTILAGGNYCISIPDGETPAVVAVADGVGGNAAGDVAAHMAASQLSSLFVPQNTNEESLSQYIKDINRRIIRSSEQNAHLKKMATTLSGICRVQNRWLLFHVGNTRVYVWRKPYLNQLTNDHTWARVMKETGMPNSTIQHSGRSSEINSCLGNGDSSFASALKVTDVTEEINAAQLIILTSDGIHDYIPEESLEYSLDSIQDYSHYLEQARAFARKNNSTDDLSFVIMDLQE